MKTEKINGHDYLNVQAVAQKLGLSAHYVRMQIRWGRIPAVRLRNQYWVASTDVHRELEQRQTPTPVVPATHHPRKKGAR